MPAFCTVAGLNVLDGLVYLPRTGVWHADLNVDSFSPLSGSVSIQLGSQTLNGTVTRSGSDVSKRLRVRIVGGNAGLGKVLPPKSYWQVPLRIPLTDAITGAGETLSATADPNLLGMQLLAWSCMQGGTAGGVVGALMASVPNTAWRVLIDGTVWCGYESWPPSSLPDTVTIHSEPEKGRVTIASDAPSVLPGTAFSYTPPGSATQTKNVSYVRHVIRPDSIRTLVFYE